MHRSIFFSFFLLGTALLTQGCSDPVGAVFGRTIQAQMGWKAERFFDDPKVIELCHAIEANDISKVDQLVKEGVNVNALGRGNMNPLFWAFPGNNLKLFERVLEHGADPNVIMTKEVYELTGRAKNWMMIDAAVTHYVCITSHEGFFEAVFDHGGDPNLIVGHSNGARETPLFLVIQANYINKLQKVKRLIDLGADVNHILKGGGTPLLASVLSGRFNHGVTLLLLNSGADYKRSYQDGRHRLIHELALLEGRRKGWSSGQEEAEYLSVVEWLRKHGESIDAARAEIASWELEVDEPAKPNPNAFK